MKRRSLWKPHLHITLLVAAIRILRSWDWSLLSLFLFLPLLLFLLTFHPLCSIHLHPIQTKTPYDLLMAFLSTILPPLFCPLPFILSHHPFLPSLQTSPPSRDFPHSLKIHRYGWWCPCTYIQSPTLSTCQLPSGWSVGMEVAVVMPLPEAANTNSLPC